VFSRREILNTFAGCKVRRTASLGAEHYTNTVLRTHENKQVKFYDDLIQDKLVVINFMYANCGGSCPVSTANLVRVQKMLGDRVGRDVFMYSITLKPEQDNPATLKQYAEMHGVKPGWLFLTGNPDEITTLRFRLFRWDQPALDFDLVQHTGMVRVINDPLDRWSMCPTLARPEQIVEAIHWVEPTKPLSERFADNIAAQVRIDREARGLRPTLATAGE
jgi:protein SCO1/2